MSPLFDKQIQEFLSCGGAIKVIKPSPPRKSELIKSNKFSIAHTGRLKSRLRGSSSVDPRILP